MEKWIPHEKYIVDLSPPNPRVRNNIALIKTTEPIEYSELVAPIALHPKFIDGGIVAITSGWGDTNVSVNGSVDVDYYFNAFIAFDRTSILI